MAVFPRLGIRRLTLRPTRESGSVLLDFGLPECYDPLSSLLPHVRFK